MSRSPRADVVHATCWGLASAGAVLAAIYFGSRRLRDFDPALVPYAGWMFGLQHAPPAMVSGVSAARIGAAAFSLAATGALMILLKAAHPPAGATTLIISLGIVTKPFHLLVIEIAVAILTLQAIAINRLAGIDYPLWAQRQPAP